MTPSIRTFDSVGSAGSDRRAIFVVEPLEQGFGLTLGNSLRRVLLSSLQGAAVTAVRIENVLHEFSSLTGVREDVVDIVFAVKRIALRMEGDGPKLLRIAATGPTQVTAGDIATSSDIEVMNPELAICHLDEGATLNMELMVAAGKGYVPASENRPAVAPIGLIAVDSLYSPVRQVAYKVDRAQAGGGPDAERLTITIETDGAVSPVDALAYSARILQDQIGLFSGGENGVSGRSKASDPVIRAAGAGCEPLELPLAEPNPAPSYESHPALLRPLSDFEFSLRAANGLRNENLIYVGDLVVRTEAELLRLPNFGRKSLTELKNLLALLNLHFGMTLPAWPPDDIDEIRRSVSA